MFFYLRIYVKWKPSTFKIFFFLRNICCGLWNPHLCDSTYPRQPWTLTPIIVLNCDQWTFELMKKQRRRHPEVECILLFLFQGRYKRAPSKNLNDSKMLLQKKKMLVHLTTPPLISPSQALFFLSHFVYCFHFSLYLSHHPSPLKSLKVHPPSVTFTPTSITPPSSFSFSVWRGNGGH